MEKVLTEEKTIRDIDEIVVKPTTEDIIKIKSSVDKLYGTYCWPKVTPRDELEDKAPYLQVVPNHQDDYFDNEDGFWDGFIQQRFARRSQLPLMKAQNYFKH